jgi:predicted ATP-dependent endonuclease of OLD family
MIELRPGRVPRKTTIQRLRIKGLHGYLDKDIQLNSDINLLVGINGSGKTSVLNIISWLLQPAIPQLCVTEFQHLTLDLIQSRKKYRIHCVQTANDVKLFVRGQKSKSAPLVVQLQRPAAMIQNNAEQQELLEAYSGLQPVKGEHKTWNFLQGLPSPIVVGLERTLGSERMELQISAAKAPSLGHAARALRAPLRRVQDLASEAFGRYRAHLIRLNDDLRDKMTLAAFDIGSLPTTSKRPSAKVALLTTSQITALEERVARYFGQESQLRRTREPTYRRRALIAKGYFKKLRSLLKMSEQRGKGVKDALWPVITGQFRKITRLFADFERFEAASKAAYAEIKQYLDTLNRFFTDSGKKLTFDFNTGNLFFEMLGEDRRPQHALRSIENLSSGEKQIAILFTYLAFSPGKIFIIDEPELSLHPRWQEEFLDAVREVMPKETQLIIATHSPAIVGKHVEYCKTLLPYNK